MSQKEKKNITERMKFRFKVINNEAYDNNSRNNNIEQQKLILNENKYKNEM